MADAVIEGIEEQTTSEEPATAETPTVTSDYSHIEIGNKQNPMTLAVPNKPAEGTPNPLINRANRANYPQMIKQDSQPGVKSGYEETWKRIEEKQNSGQPTSPESAQFAEKLDKLRETYQEARYKNNPDRAPKKGLISRFLNKFTIPTKE